MLTWDPREKSFSRHYQECKGLDLIECLKNYGQRFIRGWTGGGDQNNPQEKEMQKGRMVV